MKLWPIITADAKVVTLGISAATVLIGQQATMMCLIQSHLVANFVMNANLNALQAIANNSLVTLNEKIKRRFISRKTNQLERGRVVDLFLFCKIIKAGKTHNSILEPRRHNFTPNIVVHMKVELIPAPAHFTPLPTSKPDYKVQPEPSNRKNKKVFEHSNHTFHLGNIFTPMQKIICNKNQNRRLLPTASIIF